MNCREFQPQAADWLAGRLAPEHARQMDSHRKTCAACARATLTEIRLRETWRDAAAARPAVPDLWPRIARRLETPDRPAVRARLVVSPPARWAFSGAAVLAAVALLGWNVRPPEMAPLQTPPGRSSDLRPGSPGMAAPPLNTVTLSALTDVSQVNADVDDPVGNSMEDVWTHLKPHKAAGR